MATYKVTVDISGPLFDGHAEEVANQVVESAAKEIAVRAQREIRAQAWTMNKSGRGGTGRAAAGVLLYDHGTTQVIYGEMIKGQVWWPWLEGISKRNDSTPFKGYWTFKTTAGRWDKLGGLILQDKLDERIAEMGGG